MREISYAAERELVGAVLRGDERAFRAFFDDFYPRIYRFALPCLRGDHESARDIAQSTLIKALRNLSGYRHESALFSWLCQICSRQIADLIRANGKHTKHLVSLDEDLQKAAEEVAAADEPHHAYETAATCRLIESVLEALPRQYGDVIRWKYINDRSVEEIGALLGTGTKAAQSMLARGRSAFKDLLERALGPTAAQDA